MNLAPRRQFIRVVLPAPLGPIRATHSPSDISNETSFKIYLSFMTLLIFFAVIIFLFIILTTSFVVTYIISKNK